MGAKHAKANTVFLAVHPVSGRSVARWARLADWRLCAPLDLSGWQPRCQTGARRCRKPNRSRFSRYQRLLGLLCGAPPALRGAGFAGCLPLGTSGANRLGRTLATRAPLAGR